MIFAKPHNFDMVFAKDKMEKRDASRRRLKWYVILFVVCIVGLWANSVVKLQQCRHTAQLAVQIHAMESLAFECARVKCDKMDKVIQYVDMLYVGFDSAAEQCLGVTVSKEKYGAEI